MFRRNQIGIAKRRVVAEGEIEKIDARVTAQTITSTKCPAMSSVPVKTITMVYCTKAGTKLSLAARRRTVHTTVPSSTAWMMRLTRLAARADQHLVEHDALPER